MKNTKDNELEKRIKQLKESPLVKEKTYDNYPGLSSFNFTRDAFFNNTWDEISISARGIFFDTETSSVVSRGYDKFFNIGEKDSTSPLKTLKKFLCSEENPTDVYLKENGFLGIVGIYKDKLFIASKSTPESDFADIIRELLTDEQKEKIEKVLKETNKCLTLEVIDPIKDPHIIEEPKLRVVLLDVFERDLLSMKKVPYEELGTYAKLMGIDDIKIRIARFTNDKDLKLFIDDFTTAQKNFDIEYGKYNGKNIEGVVFENSKLDMVKAKYPYYENWKYVRGQIDRYVKIQEEVNPKVQLSKLKSFIDKTSQHRSPLVREFAKWLIEESPKVEDCNLFLLRKKFENHNKPKNKIKMKP